MNRRRRPPPRPRKEWRRRRRGKPRSTPQIAAAEPVAKYAYDPAGRRDPFEPLLLIKKPIVQSEPLTPLQSYEIGQLRLIAVIIGKGTPTAMVIAPDGKGYILKKGIKVGKNNGTVLAIHKDAVLVEEKYIDFSGEIRKNTQEIQLPKREGV